MKPKILPLALAMLIVIQACASPIPQPSQLPIASVTPTNRPANTPIPLQTDVPTNTPLPPLPDFSEHLYFEFGGGADEDCYERGDAPKIDGAIQIDFYAQRRGTLCVYDVPVAQAFHISLTSPDGGASLEGDFEITDSPDGLKVIWMGHEKQETFNEIYLYDDGVTADIRFRLWWAGGLPGGDWKAEVAWDGGEATGLFNVPVSQQAEIYLLDPHSSDEILLSDALYSSCHPANDVGKPSIGGSNFPPAKLVYLLVYQKIPDGGGLTQKVEQQAVLADGVGKFETTLTESLSQGGQYWVIAGTSPDFVDSNTEESMLDSANVGNAIDCFIVP